jgi:hypothetical protein
MADPTIDFCVANRLTASLSTSEDGTPTWLVSNQRTRGLAAPGRITGAGATIDEALKAYLQTTQEERVIHKAILEAYVADPIADVDLAKALTDDEAPLKVPAAEEKVIDLG